MAVNSVPAWHAYPQSVRRSGASRPPWPTLGCTRLTVPALSVDAGARELGEWGEEVAARLLTAHGYAVLARNWRCRHGELDIVASAPTASTVVGVEVKTRRKGGRVGAIEAVSPEKAARLRRLLAAWADEHDARCDRLRVDLLAITVDDAGECLVEHVEGLS